MSDATKVDRGSLDAEARLDDANFYLGDPYPTYERLRREAPVYYCEPGGFWALSKHKDIVWVETQPNPPFSSQQGMNIAEAAAPTQSTEIRDRELGSTTEPVLTAMADPPEHNRFRGVVANAFARERMQTLTVRIEAIVSELLDALPVGSPVNFVDGVSVPLSTGVIGETLGIPRERWADLRRWTDAYMLDAVRAFAPGSPEADQARRDQEEMYIYLAQTLAERRQDPSDDFMSTLAVGFQDQPLGEQSQIAACLGLVIAGTDTTRNTISGAMVSFAEHPDQWDRLRANPDYLKNATEEILRWVTPVMHFGRRATETVTIRDQEIKPGEFVVMLYAAANRDEEVWPDADVFDIARPIEHRQLAFGWGLHRCVGAAIARAEIDAVLVGMMSRFKGWELAGEPKRHPSTQVKDYQSVPVILEAL